MQSLQADVDYLDREIDRLSREINESLRVLNTPRTHASRDQRQRPVMRTSTPYARHRESVSGYVRGDECMHHNRDGERPAEERRPPVMRTHQTQPRVDTDQRGQVRSKSRSFVKAATYDGTGLWNDYLSHFESVCKLNEWTDAEKALYLAASLRGQAQGVLGNLPRDDRESYRTLVKALQDRFAPLNQTELYRAQLRERRQKPSESLPEMGQDIRRLVNLAYPTAPTDVREILATEQFLDGLYNSEMRLKIKQARPLNLNDAIQRAVELEAYNRAERQRTDNIRVMNKDSTDTANVSKIDQFMETVEKNMRSLQKDMRDIKQWKFQSQSYRPQSQGSMTRQNNSKPQDRSKVRKCYNCGSDEHLKRNCPMPPKENSEKGQEMLYSPNAIEPSDTFLKSDFG